MGSDPRRDRRCTRWWEGRALIIIDASAIVEALVGPPNPDLVGRLAGDDGWQAPHLLDTETLHVLRRLVNERELSAAKASRARNEFASLTIDRHPHAPLSDRVWELRHNLSAYDATYVALAETLNAPLVTCDGRLSRSRGHRATIEAFAR
jgi:predicted nucleic acid-binding protein